MTKQNRMAIFDPSMKGSIHLEKKKESPKYVLVTLKETVCRLNY